MQVEALRKKLAQLEAELNQALKALDDIMKLIAELKAKHAAKLAELN